MQSMALFNLALRQNEWLSQRQSVLAGNIANANTPGYKARDIQKFDAVMDDMSSLAATNPSHFGGSANRSNTVASSPGKSGEVLQSGNNVSLEQEFLKTGEVMKQFTFNNQIVKAFDRMLSAAKKV
jgi:flagellar basal-body rod protein FlgB